MAWVDDINVGKEGAAEIPETHFSHFLGWPHSELLPFWTTMLPPIFSELWILCMKIAQRSLFKIPFPGLHFRLTESERLRVEASQTQHMLFPVPAVSSPPAQWLHWKNSPCVSGVSLDVPVSKNVSSHLRQKVMCCSFVFPLSSLVFGTLHAVRCLHFYLSVSLWHLCELLGTEVCHCHIPSL